MNSAKEGRRSDLSSVKKILVTGGASFIGRYIVSRLLQRGWDVTVFDNFAFGNEVNLRDFHGCSNFRYVTGDIRSLCEVNEIIKTQDIVIHLAAFLTSVINKAPYEAIDVNVSGARNVLQCAANHGVDKVILGSSVSCYGFAEGDITEYCPFNVAPLHWGAGIYGASKILAEKYGQMIAETSPTKVVSLRYGTVYGPHQHWRGVDAPFFIRIYEELKAGRTPQVPGDGTEAHDYIDVRDAAIASEKALDYAGAYDTVNVVTGASTTLLECVQLISDVTGYVTTPEFSGSDSSQRGITASNFTYSTTKAADILRFRASIDLRRGVHDLLEWWDAEGYYPREGR